MSLRLTLAWSLLLLSGCREATVIETEEFKTSPRIHLERLIEKEGEVTLFGWNGTQNKRGAHFRMSFLKDSVVKLDILGYNFVIASGSYRFNDDATIKVNFHQIWAPKDSILNYTNEWPLLKLREEEGDLLISRDDGKTAWHSDWPLYPEVTQDLWPARTEIIQKRGHGKAR